jgi:hypothetical protein
MTSPRSKLVRRGIIGCGCGACPAMGEFVAQRVETVAMVEQYRQTVNTLAC